MFFKFKKLTICTGSKQYYDDPIGGLYPTYPWGEKHSIEFGRFKLALIIAYSEKKKEALQEEQDREYRIRMNNRICPYCGLGSLSWADNDSGVLCSEDCGYAASWDQHEGRKNCTNFDILGKALSLPCEECGLYHSAKS